MNKGFTLLEVMVALAIIAIALSSLIKASGSHTYSAAYLKTKTLGHYVALNEIAKIQIDRKWPSLGTTNKSTEMAGVEWFWTRTIEKTADESGNIRGLKFTVYMDEDRKNNVAHIQAFISNPTQLTTISDTSNGSNTNQNSQQTGGPP